MKLYNFNLNGLLTSIQDRYGNTVAISHDSNGMLTSVADQNGRSIAFAYNANGTHGQFSPWGWYTTATTPTGTFQFNVRQQTYNSAVRVLGNIWFPLVGQNGQYGEAFGYDYSGEIVGEDDLDGSPYLFTYDSNRRLKTFNYPVNFYANPVTLTGNAGNLTYTYLYGYSATSMKDPYGNSVTDNYDYGTLASHVDEAGYPQNFTWDINYNLTQLQDQRKNYSYYTYDQFGNMASSADTIQHNALKSEKWTYNSYNDVLTDTDCRGAVTTYNRNGANGTVLSVTDGLNNTLATYSWNSNGTLSSAATQGGTTSIAYNSKSYPSSITTPDQTYSIVYQGLPGQISSVSDSLSRTTTVGYDQWSRITSLIRSDTSTYSLTLDPMSRVVATSDWNGKSSTFSYDAVGRLSSSQNARGDTEQYYWFDLDRLAGVKNGDNNLRTYTYAKRGEETACYMPNGTDEIYQYDGDADVTTRANGMGIVGTYSYDTADELTGISYPSGHGVTMAYDTDGRTTSETDGTGTYSWVYDLGDRLTNFNSPQGNLTYSYDQWGRETQVDEGGGVKIQYAFTGPRLTSQTKLPENETTSWTYDGIGRLSKQTFPNGATESFAYDNLDRLASLTHATSTSGNILSETYAYDANSNLTSKTSNGVTTSYTYDNIGQLLSESFPGYSGSYTYDSNGNRLSRTVNGSTENYTYDSGDKLQSVTVGSTTEKSYTYDAAGRTSTVTSAAGTTQLSYDFEDRIIGITMPGRTNSMTYNAFDARVSKVDSTGTKTYLRDGEDPVDDVLSDGSLTYNPGISSHSSAGTKFEHQDYLGTNKVETDSSQNVAGSRSYDAFGNPTSTTGSPQGPFGFAGNWGYQEDPDSGLKLLGHRYYDPSTGRFLTRDPVEYGRNWFRYASGDPIHEIDPSGNKPNWIMRSIRWFADPEVPWYAKASRFFLPVMAIKGVAGGVAALYIAHVNGDERIKMDRIYQQAAKLDGNLEHGVRYYRLQRENDLEALPDAANVWTNWWKILWDIR